MDANWVNVDKDPQHVARERERARELRKSPWWQSILEKGVCHYCGKHVGKDALTMDHVIPVARGGKSVRSNVVPCCKACNSKKSCLTPAEQILNQLEESGELSTDFYPEDYI